MLFHRNVLDLIISGLLKIVFKLFTYSFLVSVLVKILGAGFYSARNGSPSISIQYFTQDKIQSFLKDSHLQFEAVSIFYSHELCHTPLTFSAGVNMWSLFSLHFLPEDLPERMSHFGFAQSDPFSSDD